MGSPFIHTALLQETVNDEVRCLTCERRCELAEGQVGWCRTRQNRGGTIYTLTYGLVSSLSCNPIEKKPLYHFYPGSVALTAGSLSCNFACPWCQNWDISKQAPPTMGSGPRQSQPDRDPLAHAWRQAWDISREPPSGGEFIAPQAFIEQAQARGCQGTSISFNEPTLSLEWSLEVLALAREAGLYNTFVTNGYMTEAALDRLVEAGLDGMNVDVKGDAETVRRYCKADVDVVWRTCQRAQERGVWVEVTTLVIPTVNDGDKTLRTIAGRMAAELGPETPWHVTRYHPAYGFHALPTPVSTLEREREIGVQAGLHYVYVGNVRDHPGNQTSCPGCGATLIVRRWLHPTRCDVTSDGRCPHCGQKIAGTGWDGAAHNP